MKLAAIDIGSNSVRLLIMNVYETDSGTMYSKDTIYRIPLRLGEEAFLQKKISDEKVEALVKTMKAFKHILELHQTDAFMACATSAMREAKNRKKVIERVKEKTDISIEVISGQMEADIIFDNHIEEFAPEDAKDIHNYLYIDVGGGSTELVLISDGALIDKSSFNIGTLRLKHDMVSNAAWNEMRMWLYQYKSKYTPITAIGSGGSINHVLKNYSKSKNNILSFDIIEACYRMLKVIPDEDKVLKLGMRADRADVIIPALEIFRKVMNWADIEEIFVPKLGLPEGIIKRLYKKITGKKK